METQLPDITVGDINLAVNVIDVAAKRGAFDTTEFELIGKLTTKFRSFISTISEANKETQTEELNGPEGEN